MNKSIKFNILWGYAVELIGSAAVYVLALGIFGVPRLSKFVRDTCDEWNDLTGILLAAALTVWLTFINIRGSLFGDYLARKRDDSVYSRAFLTAMVVFFVTTASMIVVRGICSNIFTNLGLFLLFYSLINFYSMMKNATDLIKLYSAFKREMEIERIRMGVEQNSLTDGD